MPERRPYRGKLWSFIPQLCLVVVACLPSAQGSVIGVTLQNAQYSVGFSGNCGSFSTSSPGSISQKCHDQYGGFFAAVGSIQGGASPKAFGSASANTNSPYGGYISGGGGVDYQFWLLAPPGAPFAQIDLLTSGSLSASGDGGGIAHLQVWAGDGATGNLVYEDLRYANGGWNLNTTLTIATNTIFNVAISADCTAFTHGSCVASSDPMITVDPNQPNASQYQLIFSPGLFPTPEPSCALLLGSAFATVLANQYRRWKR
jgi:hypothetical protein